MIQEMLSCEEYTVDIDLNTLSPTDVYFSMIQTLVPRPIAWVLSENADGRFNLAPFSYFTAVSSNPPLVMISVGKKPDGSDKDTHVNIKTRQHFVIHIPSREQLEVMNQSSATLPAEQSEVDELHLETVSFAGFSLPRLKDAKIAFGCECYEIHNIGNTPQAMILGRVDKIYIDDEVLVFDAKNRYKVDTNKLDPVARLGASEYLLGGEVTKLDRPF
jgi:flavin reductase (DIM6/NTAB) family NADH-FMN oxidoreductase RutF